MTDEPLNEPRGGRHRQELEPWSEMFSRYTTQIGILGAILVLGLILAVVFVVNSGSSQSPLRGQALQDAAGPPVTLPAFVPTKKSRATRRATAASSSSSPSNTVATTVKPSAVAPAEAAARSATSAPPASPLEPCTPADVSITTSTDSSSYAPGSTVTATTRLVDQVACGYDPTPSGQYSCPTTVVITDSAGNQIYPERGQAEQCAQVQGGDLEPGATRTVVFDWPEDAALPTGSGPAPPAQYKAVATWSWTSSTASPNEVTSASGLFTIGLFATVPNTQPTPLGDPQPREPLSSIRSVGLLASL